MHIKAEKSSYHIFALYYDYNPQKVEFCRALKETYGWQNFTFNSEQGLKRWVFSDPVIVQEIVKAFPDTLVDSDVARHVAAEFKHYAAAEAQQTEVQIVQQKTDTDITIKGIKGELYPYQKVGVEFLIASGGRAIIADPPGCLSGDTKMIINRGGNARTFTLRDLYYRFNGGITNNGNGPRKWRDDVISNLRVLQDNGEFRLTQIKRVIESGVKSVITVTAKTEFTTYRIDLTPDHLIMTPNGWVEAQNLKSGDQIVVNGKRWCEVCEEETEHADSEYTKKWRPKNYGCCRKCIRRASSNYKGFVGTTAKGKYLEVGGLFAHPIKKKGIRAPKKNGGTPAILQHILVYEAAQNGVSYEEWCTMCRTNTVPQNAFFVDTRKYAVHHINGIKTDNRIENLQLLTHREHSLAHKADHIKKLWNVNSQTAIVSSVVDEGKTIDTYDIEMDGEYPNFVANGIVVHNCGKSLQALAYIAHENFSRSLIVCPASVKSSWVKEAKKWTKMSFVEIDSKTDLSKIPADINLWIVNYDVLKKHLNTLLKTRFDCVTADEVHMVKSRTAQRTKALMAIAKHVPHIVLLSGTPLLSRPVEMYTLLNMVDPRTWNNWYDFTRKYCGGHQGRFGYEVGGATNTEELHTRIKRHFIRRQKKDVLTQLPPKVRIDVPVQLSPEMAEQYSAAEEDLASFLMMYKGKQPAEVAKMVAAEQLAKLNVLRQITAIGKIPTASDLIESVLEAGEKILVFSSFMEPLRQLQEKYADCSVMITGETSVQDRGAIVTKFQEDPNTKIFFGGIRSAGVGITLTAASNVVFLDYAWTPADMLQAEDRVHRPSQEASSVNIYQLHAEGTIDGRLLKLLKQKQVIFDKVIEGAAVLKEDHQATKQAFRDVVADVMERNKKDASVVSAEEFESLFGKVET
jgi:SWI/SNF-related matrix-associated actin-dependent regulator 1 of chromatin subfamily A